jgi:hypothetical protein
MDARLAAALMVTVFSAAGCNLFGGESAESVAARRESDGKAVGGACRHAGRAIEDCYTLNRRADKAAMYAGWREMNDYMRENKLEPVAPQLTSETVAQSGDGEGKKSAHSEKAEKSDKSDKAVEAADTPVEKPRAKEGSGKSRKKDS